MGRRSISPAFFTLGYLSMFLAAHPAPAALPGADDPQAYTQHDWLRDHLEYNTRTLAGAYQEVGKHDAKWDAAATKFLKGTAHRMTYGAAHGAWHPQPQPIADDQ